MHVVLWIAGVCLAIVALVYLAALIKVLRDNRRRRRAERVEVRRPAILWLPEDHWWNKWMNR